MGGHGGGGGNNAALEQQQSDLMAQQQAQLKASQDAQAQHDRMTAQQAEDEDAIRRGLRGTRSLMSSAGQLGYSQSLGG